MGGLRLVFVPKSCNTLPLPYFDICVQLSNLILSSVVTHWLLFCELTLSSTIQIVKLEIGTHPMDLHPYQICLLSITDSSRYDGSLHQTLPRKEVIRRLRERGEPITMFGESETDSFQRLRQCEIQEPEINKVIISHLWHFSGVEQHCAWLISGWVTI